MTLTYRTALTAKRQKTTVKATQIGRASCRERVDAPEVKTNELDAIRNKLVEALNEYAERNKLKGLNGLPCFVVSDIWTFAGVLHIDISHVVNQATVDYLHDVTKSEKD